MLLLHAQTEQIRFGNSEVEILIKKLRNLIRGACIGCLCCKIFEEDAGEGGEEVDVGGGVEPLLQIGGDMLEVLGGRLEEIDDWNVGDRISCSCKVPIVT